MLDYYMTLWVKFWVDSTMLNIQTSILFIHFLTCKSWTQAVEADTSANPSEKQKKADSWALLWITRIKLNFEIHKEVQHEHGENFLWFCAHLYLTGRVLYTVTDLYETMYYRHSGDILFVL